MSLKTHSLNAFRALENLHAFLNIRKAGENKKLSNFLDSQLTTMSGAGAQVRQNTTETKELGKAFDGIIYLDKTHKIQLG